MLDGHRIASKILTHAELKGTPRTVLGEVLGAKKSSRRQWKYQKLNSFLKDLQKNIINRGLLKKIATHYEKPEEFFSMEEDTSGGSNVNYGSGKVVQTKGNGNDISVSGGNGVYEQIMTYNDDQLQDLITYAQILRKRRGE